MLFGPRHWKAFAAMIGMAFAVGARTIYATSVVAHSGAGFTAGITPLAYLTAQGIVILRYIGMIVVPWGYTVDPTIPMPAVWMAIAAWLLIAAGAVLAVRYRPWIWFSAGILLLLPSSSILPAEDLAADRRMYLPMIAFCVLIAWLARSQKWAGLVAAVLIVLSIGRMETWKTERSLWEEAVLRSPDKARPRIQLARALPPTEALTTLQGAPQTPDVITELGRVYLDAARPAEALREFGRALALQPGNARAVNNRGVALLALGQKAAARKDFERALAMNPDLQDARDNLARTDATAAK
jgi:protein O-mannosyl-transferase